MHGRAGGRHRLAGILVSVAVVTSTLAVGPAAAVLPTRSIYTAGSAVFHGSTGDSVLNGPLVDMAVSPGGGGYWQLGSDGGVFSYGDAPFFGSTGDIKLNKPVVSMSPTRTGAGYWFVASDGGIFSFGDAGFFGSTGDMQLSKPVVGMAPTSSGNGYLLVAADGGVFAFGDAAFSGSLGDQPPAAPIVSLTPRPSGDGYWLLDREGKVYAFGQADTALGDFAWEGGTYTDLQSTPSGNGYWILNRHGTVLPFGDAADLHPDVNLGPGQEAIGVASTADGQGLWVTTSGRSIPRTAGSAGPHTFLGIDSRGRPARWNPCAPITWLFNPDLAPAGAEDLLRDGFDYVGAITGMSFRYGGTTSVDTGPSIPGTVIVGWTPGVRLGFPGQSGPVPAGRASPAWSPAPGGALRITAAGIRLNADFIEDRDPEMRFFWMGTNWKRDGWGPVFLHELAHVLGLGHVFDPDQIMHPDGGSGVGFGPGDLAGLHRLGAAAGCL